jgi:hypothetical protein
VRRICAILLLGYTCEAGFRAKEIALRVRDPGGRPAARVEVDGRTWDRFDGQRELIFLGPESGVRKIRVYFWAVES